jgi:hypothetical protein
MVPTAEKKGQAGALGHVDRDLRRAAERESAGSNAANTPFTRGGAALKSGGLLVPLLRPTTLPAKA